MLALSNMLNPMLVLAVAAPSGLIRPSDIGMRSALVGALLGTDFMAVFGMAPAYAVICVIHLAGMLLLMAAGICQSVSMITLSIILLRTSEPRFRGRIMGVRMLAIHTLPLGLLAAGAMIPKVGFVPNAMAMLLLGLVLVSCIATLWRDDLLRRHAPSNARK